MFSFKASGIMTSRTALIGALLLSSGAAIAQSAFTTLDRTSTAQISFAAAERGKPILAGSEVTVSGEGFRPGQQVSLMHGTTPLGGALIADGEGKVTGKVGIPAAAVHGIHPILVTASSPYFATVADLKVSPTVPLSGQTGYEVTEAQASRGLYQSAYSARNDALFVTSAIGRPPVRQSELVKLDARTLKVVARVTPQAAPQMPARPGEEAREPGLYAVYGVGVDDSKDMLWVTNTRQNTVSVYRQADLSLVKQFAPGTVGHPRDAVVDQARGKAYVSSTGKPEVAVFDTEKLEVAKTVQLRSLQRGKDFSAASLSFDAKAGRLYVASLSTNEVAIVNTSTDLVEKVFPVPAARGVIGISHDPATGRIFVAAQGSDNLVVLDGTSGAVVADTPVGAGALNVAFDPVKRRAYVSNRGAGTIAVADADGKLVANLGPAPSANHVSLGKDGTIYAVDKSANARDAESDTILRIRPRK